MKKLLIIILAINLFAQNEISEDWLKEQPKTIAKDFYIWRYLDQNITPKQALDACGQIQRFNNKLFFRYIDKSDNKTLKSYKSCVKSKTKDLLNKKPYCIEAGLSVYDATKLPSKSLKKVINRVKNEYPQLAKKLKILNSTIPFVTLEQVDKKTFFDTFNQVGSVYRAKYFNHHISLKTIKRLRDNKKFAQTIKLIVTNTKMNKAQKSLLNITPEGLNFKSTFHLAINAIRHDKKDMALIYLENAFNKAYYKMDKDNITFWQYKLTKEKQYLDKLINSWDINIYSLYATSFMNKKQNNIIFDIEQKTTTIKEFDTTSPFEWIKILEDSKNIDKNKLSSYQYQFTNESTLGHLAFVQEKYDKYRNSYFITPYEKFIGKLPQKRQALIYALARQESRFIPTSISTSYAMGAMQIMPFLSKAIAKQLKDDYDIDKQLDPKTNLKYANHHLNYLEKNLKHPLFIAYGYNGGIGFTKRILKSGLFKKGKYEPYLSMELLPFDETKKYGKKVLANYYIYKNHIDKKEKINFNSLLNIIN